MEYKKFSKITKLYFLATAVSFSVFAFMVQENGIINTPEYRTPLLIFSIFFFIGLAMILTLAVSSKKKEGSISIKSILTGILLSIIIVAFKTLLKLT